VQVYLINFMTELIRAHDEVTSSPWMSPEVKEVVLQYSVAVNNLHRAFKHEDEIRLIDILLRHQREKITQISLAYEVPPYFTRL
jgi:hypothetical protein